MPVTFDPPDPRKSPEPRKTATEVYAERQIRKTENYTWPPGPNEGDHSSTEAEYDWLEKKEKYMQTMSEKDFRAKYEGTFPVSTSNPYGSGWRSEEFSEWHKNYVKGENNMANKFLPFVVENSTPLHMFKTLLSRSKGMNQVLIASVFHLILKVDIKTLRTEVKELPEMALEKIYEELLIKRPTYRVIDEVLADYQTIHKFFPAVDYWAAELKKYDANDAMLFFCSMAYAEKEILDYTEYPYDLIKSKSANDEILGHLSRWTEFSDKGEETVFKNAAELRCYALYCGLFRNLMEPDSELTPIKAVIEPVKK